MCLPLHSCFTIRNQFSLPSASARPYTGPLVEATSTPAVCWWSPKLTSLQETSAMIPLAARARFHIPPSRAALQFRRHSSKRRHCTQPTRRGCIPAQRRPPAISVSAFPRSHHTLCRKVCRPHAAIPSLPVAAARLQYCLLLLLLLLIYVTTRFFFFFSCFAAAA